MTIAAVSWWIDPSHTAEDWHAYGEARIREAVALGADFVVLPELIDLGLLAGHDVPLTDQPTFCASLNRFPAVAKSLASELGVTICAGSWFAKRERGWVNESITFFPDGAEHLAEKQILTQFEIEDWGLIPGVASGVHEAHATTICYDSEFSRLWEPLDDEGALVVAVPTFTETEFGANRVATCCQARATEFQMIVAKASLRGALDGEPVPSTAGSSAIYAPQVPGFPSTGILAQSDDIAVATVDLATLPQVREQGDVRNNHDQRALRRKIETHF